MLTISALNSRIKKNSTKLKSDQNFQMEITQMKNFVEFESWNPTQRYLLYVQVEFLNFTVFWLQLKMKKKPLDFDRFKNPSWTTQL